VPSEPRAGLGPRRPRRPHPASPDAAPGRNEQITSRARGVPRDGRDEDLVMFCVRVTPSLRRRLKLIAADRGRPLQALAAEALEAWCRQCDM
jgi:hypothetical protein